MVQNSELTRKEAYSVLGRRGAAKRRNPTAKGSRDKVLAEKLISDDMKGVKRGDLVVKNDSRAVFRILEDIDAKGGVLCEDSDRRICYFHASKLTLVAVSIERAQPCSGSDFLLDLLN